MVNKKTLYPHLCSSQSTKLYGTENCHFHNSHLLVQSCPEMFCPCCYIFLSTGCNKLLIQTVDKNDTIIQLIPWLSLSSYCSTSFFCLLYYQSLWLAECHARHHSCLWLITLLCSNTYDISQVLAPWVHLWLSKAWQSTPLGSHYFTIFLACSRVKTNL